VGDPGIFLTFYMEIYILVLFAVVFLARDSIYAIARYMLSPVCVRLSVTRVDQSKTVEVRIMQPSPQNSPF